MTQIIAEISDLHEAIAAAGQKRRRRAIAVAGPPASGKSTLAEVLSRDVPDAAVVPMDGFHLDNRILEPRGLLPRKGSPPSFDAAGFAHMVARICTEDAVIYPLFDRSLDCAIAGAGFIGPETKTVFFEGNYLAFDDPDWMGLTEFWDLSVFLDVDEDVLEARLVQRWLDQGLSPKDARARALSNDLPNAVQVKAQTLPVDVTYKGNM